MNIRTTVYKLQKALLMQGQKNKNQSDTGVFPESREDDNEIHCH